MLTHLEPIGRQKYQLWGQRAAPYLMERFILVLFLMCANVWIITSSKSKTETTADGYLWRTHQAGYKATEHSVQEKQCIVRLGVFLPLCGKIMTRNRVIWRKVPWNGVGLFRWAMCMTFLTAAPRIRIQIWCPCVFGWDGVALYFTCEMERPFGKQALSGLPFTHAHALCFSTLSSVWQRYSYCSSSE